LESEIEGVESFLTGVYSPLIGERFPTKIIVPINLIGK